VILAYLLPLWVRGKKKVKKFPTGLDTPLGLQEVEAPRISRESAHDDGKVFSPTHRPLTPKEIFLAPISVKG